jgi:hypothetical protein
MSFNENLIFDISDRIILKGGYDCSFTTNTGGYSTIHGSMTISNGTVEVDRIIIAP